MGEGAYLINERVNASGSFQAAAGIWAATDPVDPLRDYSIPIQPFKHPPAKDDFQQIRRRRKRQDNEPEQEPERQQDAPREDGHIDDYA